MSIRFTFLIIPSKGGTTKALKLTLKLIAQADFTDWMHFLPSNLMEELSPIPEAFSANT